MTEYTTEVKVSLVSPFTLFLLLFVTLKLTDQIDWSWLWVLSPVWLPLALVVGLLTLASIVAVALGLLCLAFGKRSKAS